MFNTNIIYFFVGTSTDLQCDQCQKTYCSKSSLNYHKKTQHKPVLLLWKMDGEHVDIQAPSNLKTEGVDLELDMKQQTIFSKNSIVLEILILWVDMRKFHDPPSEKVKKEYKCDVCQKSFVAPSHLKRNITVHNNKRLYL